MKSSNIHNTPRRALSLGTLFVFLAVTVAGPGTPVFAQSVLPLPTSMLKRSAVFEPALIKGLRIYPNNPLRFDFIVDAGDAPLFGADFEDESVKLIKYFLSSLTVPEGDLWVNLSPYERERIIPEAFGKTQMGRDLLAQDYILKQLSASLLYPEDTIGRAFWDRAYEKAREALGGADVPIDTFNKIWIVPEKAVVYAKDHVAYVVESRLKVMLEEDYLALQNGGAAAGRAGAGEDRSRDQLNKISSEVVREVVLPVIEREVNEGSHFAPLRQVYHSLILATWFKRNLRESLLGQAYVDQNKVAGVSFEDDLDKEKIYAGYLEAFKNGVYNFVKEEEDPATQESIPRKYFAGGIPAYQVGEVLTETRVLPPGASSSALAPRSHLLAVNLASTSLSLPREADPRVVGESPFDQGGLNVLRDGVGGDAIRVWGGSFRAGELIMGRIGFDVIREFKDAVAIYQATPYAGESLKKLSPVAEYLARRINQDESMVEVDSFGLLARRMAIERLLAPGERLRNTLKAAREELDVLSVDLDRVDVIGRQALSERFVEREREYESLLDELADWERRSEVAALRGELERVEGVIRRVYYSNKMAFYTRGGIRSSQNINELLSMTVDLFRALPPSQVADMLSAARVRAQEMLSFLSQIKQDDLVMENLRVEFVLNAPEVFTVTASADGVKVLQLDLMAFLREPTRAQIVALRYEFLNALAKDQRTGEIERFGRAMGSRFVAENPAVVAEVVRVLMFMEHFVDPYYGVGRFAVGGSAQEVQDLRERLFDELGADPHYARLVPLLRELGEKVNVVEYKNDNGEIVRVERLPSLSARVEAVLAHIVNDKRLAGKANLRGNWTGMDITLIASDLVLSANGSRWFASRSGEDRGDEVVDSLVERMENVFVEGQDAQLPEPVFYEDMDFLDSDFENMDAGAGAESLVGRIRFAGERAVENIRVNLRRWALTGAVAMAGFFAVGNLGQGDVSEAVDLQQGAVVTVVEPARVTGAASDSRVTEIWKNIQELRRLQEEAQAVSAQRGSVTQESAQTSSDEALQIVLEAAPVQAVPGSYIVRTGDTLSHIALRFGKSPVRGALEIAAANGIKDPDLIFPGQELIIPGTERVEIVLGAEDTSLKRVIEKVYGEVSSSRLNQFLLENPSVRSNQDLRPGLVITVTLPTERALRFDEQNAIQRELKASASVFAPEGNVGGINLDPRGLEIHAEGEEFVFDAPADPQLLRQLKEEPFHGLVPVILNVVPIFNLPQFLGAQTPPPATTESLAVIRAN